MRELKNDEIETVAGGLQDTSNPPLGAEGNLTDAVKYGVATYRRTDNVAIGVVAGVVRFFT